MKVKIKSIAAASLDAECVTLEVLQDCDIGKYIVFDSTYTAKGTASNKMRHTYWFPDKAVKAGDLVLLYTKEGKQSEQTNSSKTTTHVFYWGINHQLWNDKNDCAVLVEANAWSVKSYQA